MEALKLIPYIVLVICIAGIIAGASSLSISKFGDTMTECDTAYPATDTPVTYNSTLGLCTIAGNNTHNASLTVEFQSLVNTQEGIGDTAEQLGTVAIIGIMVIIISLIAGVFVYMRYFT